jgi:hypothetical protein
VYLAILAKILICPQNLHMPELIRSNSLNLREEEMLWKCKDLDGSGVQQVLVTREQALLLKQTLEEPPQVISRVYSLRIITTLLDNDKG